MTAWYQTAEAEEFMAFAEFATHSLECVINLVDLVDQQDAGLLFIQKGVAAAAPG